MNARLFLAVPALLAALASTPASAQRAYSIADVQGTWWSDCTLPSADFQITGTAYTGDFEGTYQASVSNNELVVDFTPDAAIVRWPIVLADGQSLVLRHDATEVRYTHCPQA